MNYYSAKILVVVASICLTSCHGTPSEQQADIRTVPPAPQPISAPAPAAHYTWATAKTGLGCMPRLRAMMDWYATQAEELRQTEFVPGEPTDGPVPQGPYQVDEEAVESYLATLRKSGYFSASYILTLQKRARQQDSYLQNKQLPSDEVPAIEGVPLFVRNYDDMLEQQGQFSFTSEQQRKAITLNDGIGLWRFVYNPECQIDSVQWMISTQSTP